MTPALTLNGVAIEDTFAEAFGMRGTRLIVTADTARWARIAGQAATGFATSVIGCGVEAGIERDLAAEETPDGRPGVALLFFAFNTELLAKAARERVGQAVLTCPGTACYAGIADRGSEGRLPLGRALRYFGDGFQAAKRIGDRRFWRIPVMDGEFLVEDMAPSQDAVGGGNFLLIGRERAGVLRAGERAIEAMRRVRGVVMPFPGGLVRSGSKVGSRYKALIASTNEPYCPTLSGVVSTALAIDEGAVLEVVIDGLDAPSIAEATIEGVRAACADAPADGLTRITAANYGGKLGAHHFHLKALLA